MTQVSGDVYGSLKQLNANTSQEELIKIYSSWSKIYDKDVNNLKYAAPVMAVEQLTQKLTESGYSKDVRILDLGCGTGLAGEQLHQRGYHNIDGIDLTPELLEVARKKGVYKSLQQGRMMSEECKDLGVAADQYEGAICIGVFIAGHVKSKGLDDIVHVVKSGGFATFTIRQLVADDPVYGFEEKMNQLTQQGKWKLITKHYEPRYINDGGAWFYTYQIL